MNDILLLYLFTRVDAVREALMAIIFASCFAIPIMCVIGHALRDHNSYDSTDKKTKDESSGKALQKWAKAISICFPFVALLLVLVPDRRDLAIIVGGHLTLEAVKSDTVQKVYTIVQDVLDEQLADIQRKRSATK